MGEKPETTVIGSLPHSRPQRRSAKRAPRQPSAPEQQPSASEQQPPAPEQQPPAPEPQPSAPLRRPSPCPDPLPGGGELIGTVVKAAAELTEIGFTLAARALRSAVARLPRP